MVGVARGRSAKRGAPAIKKESATRDKNWLLKEVHIFCIATRSSGLRSKPLWGKRLYMRE